MVMADDGLNDPKNEHIETDCSSEEDLEDNEQNEGIYGR